MWSQGCCLWLQGFFIVQRCSTEVAKLCARRAVSTVRDSLLLILTGIL